MEKRTDMEQREARTAQLFSREQLFVLKRSHVMIFGLGGVGGHAVEALGRMGVGKLTIVDKDTFEASNINRQICALTSTIGKHKAEVTKQRLMDINPDAKVVAIEQFHLPQTPVPIPDDVDIVIDAVDTVAAKLFIIQTCSQRNIPVISCMGMGNRLDPTQIKLGDIFDTSNCGLSRVMRKELRKRGIPSLRCVYSVEEARQGRGDAHSKNGTKPVPGSATYVPPVAGLLIAYDTVNTLIGKSGAADTQARDIE